MSVVHSGMLNVSDEARKLAYFLTKPILWERALPNPAGINTVRTLAAVCRRAHANGCEWAVSVLTGVAAKLFLSVQRRS